jgi:HEAT repeat protein
MRPFFATLCLVVATATLVAQGPEARKPLAPKDVDDIATLLKIEDTRQFDAAALTRIVGAAHPEVRRRAIVTIGRVVDERGKAMLTALHGQTDTTLLATVAFATGQLKDAAALPWLTGLLTTADPVVGKEAAQALGKIGTRDARGALATYLATARDTAPAVVVGEALLAIGRVPYQNGVKDDLAPIVRWSTSKDAELRWRAAWALFRPKDPAAIPTLMTLSTDASAEVRFWAMRGLAPDLVDHAGIARADAAARLRQGVNDPDRRVRTEALRALVAYDDDASVQAVLRALQSDDTWLSVSAADPTLARHKARADVVPALVAAAADAKPLSLRLSALTPLVTLAPAEAAEVIECDGADRGATGAAAARCGRACGCGWCGRRTWWRRRRRSHGRPGARGDHAEDRRRVPRAGRTMDRARLRRRAASARALRHVTRRDRRRVVPGGRAVRRRVSARGDWHR